MLPNRLKKNDTIGIVTPSNQISENHKEYIDNAIAYLKTLGLNVIFSKNAYSRDKYGISGGTANERADDINKMFSNPDINAIWCIHGGDTANEVLDLLDYTLIKGNPKIFLGKSDIDLLHLAINKQTGLVAFNSPDTKIGRGIDMDFDYSKKWFVKRLFDGESGEIEKATDWKTIRKGSAEGRIIGCNLTSILKLAGTKYFPDFENAILFLESYTANIKTTIYRLTQLKQIGVFEKITGIVVGYIWGFQDEEQLKQDPKVDKNGNKVNYEDIVLNIVKEYDFPILKINEFGHYYPNAILPIGVKAKLDASNQKIVIVDNCVK